MKYYFMKNLKIRWIPLVLTSLFACFFPNPEIFSQDLQRYNPDRELIEGVVLPNTELFKIHSDITGNDFLIYVQLPMDYKNSPDKKYPVWYNTDANRGFPLLANASTYLSYPSGEIPEIIVIGIGYLIKGMEEWAALRIRDLTPTSDPETDQYWTELLADMTKRKDITVQSGGAPQFLEFIIKELIPYVESHYRVQSENRTLGGYSFGGLFTLYCLFHHPESFHNYFAGSPSLHYNQEVIFSYEAGFAEMHQDLNARVFLTVGGLEGEPMINEVRKLTNNLSSRDYPNLEVEMHIFEGEDHRSCVGAAFFRSFYVFFDRK
jgi:predicted alpha/beta superfamily hydrolase